MGLGGGGFKIPFKRYSSVKFSSNKLTSTDWARTQFKWMLRFFGPELRNKYLSPTETSQFAMQRNAIHYGKQIRGKVTKKHNTYVVFVIWNESGKKKVLDKHLMCLPPLIITNIAIEYFDIINTMLCIVWAKTILT